MNVTEEMKRAVWNKWALAEWYNKDIVRKDIFWSLIEFNKYWNRNSIYGWEIDHIIPTDKWWTDNLINLQPLQWENNIKKSNKLLRPVTAIQKPRAIPLPIKQNINLFDFTKYK